MKFVLFLSIVFAVELAIMNLLPAVVSPASPGFVAAVVDAVSLSLVIAPVAWWLFIVPLQRRHAERGRLLERLHVAHEEERATVVRDLHDGLGQSLTALLLRMRVLEQQLKTEALRQQVVELRTITTDAASELRRMVRDTRPPVLDDQGLCSALQRKAEELSGGGTVAIDLTCDLSENQRLPAIVETAVYRIVVEAVNNAMKHASATKVRIRLAIEQERLMGEVADDGRGFQVREALRHRAFGLVGIRERCEAFQGRLTIESRPGRGTQIRFMIPCGREDCRLREQHDAARNPGSEG